MKKSITLLFLFFIIGFNVLGQSKKPIPYDTVGTDLLSLNYRIFEWSAGFEFKYFHLTEKSGLGPTMALGFVNYNNDNSVGNAVYKVNGGFGKIGLVAYHKFSGAVIYIGPNAIFSYSSQNLTAEFKDKIWGTYSQTFETSDFNLGLELALGIIVKIHKNAFLHFEGSSGSKLMHQDNPLYTSMNVDERDAYSIPYFSPGMGRGGALFINASIGVGYQF